MEQPQPLSCGSPQPRIHHPASRPKKSEFKTYQKRRGLKDPRRREGAGSKIPFLHPFHHQSLPEAPGVAAAPTASTASPVCPSRTGADAWSWLGLAFVPLALLSLSRRELFPSQRRVPRGHERGTRPAAGRRKGWDAGNPRTRGAGEEDGRAEGGRGRRWDGGEEVWLCSPPPQTTQGPQGGAGGEGERREDGGGAAQAPAPARVNLSEVRRGWEPWREDSQTDSFQL